MIRMAITALLTTAAVLALAGCQKEIVQTPVDSSRKAVLQSAIDTRYENPEAHYELGRIYHQEGSYERAEFHYNVAMGFAPKHRRVQASMVRLMQDRKDPARAASLAQMYIQQASISADVSMMLGRAFQREAMYDYAQQCYNQAAGLDPQNAAIHKQLGYFYLRRGDRVRAEGALRRSFELNPDQPDVSSELGRMGVAVTVPPRKAIDVMRMSELAKEPVDETIK